MADGSQVQPTDSMGFSVEVNRVAAPVREQCCQQLRQAIVEQRLRPAQRLIERELIEQTGVSRTTIREALRQLAAEGLVTTIPNKGTVVASPPLERAVELYEVRAVLEGMATRQFAERATALHLRELRRALEGIETAAAQKPQGNEMLAAKRVFYDVLFEGAANTARSKGSSKAFRRASPSCAPRRWPSRVGSSAASRRSVRSWRRSRRVIRTEPPRRAYTTSTRRPAMFSRPCQRPSPITRRPIQHDRRRRIQHDRQRLARGRARGAP